MKPEQATIQLNLSSRRSRQARFAAVMKKGLALVCKLLVGIFAALAVALFVAGHSAANFCVAAALFTALWVIWYTTALAKLAPRTPETTIDDVLDQTVLARLRAPVSPQIAWQALSGHWQEIFMTNRLLLSPDLIKDTLSDNEADMAAVWQRALALRPAGDPQLHAGTLTTALILSSPQLKEFMTRQKLTEDDVLACHDWLARILASDATPKPYFGGVGRDWAFGFTPNLERFSTNLSLQIQSAKSAPQFAARGGIIDAVVNGLAQTNSIAVVGDAGIGKSSAVFALAQRLLQADAPAKLKDHQIVNMILFLDEAQVFFQEGRGAFDMSHIILPVLQNKRLKLITSFNTTDFQRLKARNPSLASTLMPVMMQEPTASESMKIIQDSSLGIEYRTKRIVSYESIREAYRLSGQYIQDAAYPGKAITLLEQAAAYPDQNVITAKSVQETIEKTLGVKAGGTDTQEAASLLNLEDSIHQRMINQTAAVSAIANALRRSRAGVASTNRPIGTFLFLGPTGVGKTELARSLAATYFGDEKNMIRLDMSEYQQAQDVSRLIDAGAESDSLILQIRKQPFSVLLLDEIEKAHSSVLNLLLQLLDEGQLTDASGRPTSFRDAIVIVTSNAGSADILARVNAGESLEGFEKPLIDQLIATGVFRAELINRFDEVVLFRPLGKEELRQVAQLMLAGVNKTLGNQNISVELTNAAIDHLVDQGYDPQFGARPMRRVIQRTVEDVVAKRILSGQATPGSNITLDIQDIKNT